jgi:putative transposase
MSQRKRRSAQFKFNVALEAAKEIETLNQLSSKYEAHPSQLSEWKRQLLDEGPSLFSNPTSRQQREQAALQSELYEQIGRLQMELEWLKKKVTR